MIIRKQALRISLTLVLVAAGGCSGASQPASEEASAAGVQRSPELTASEVATSPSLPPTPSPSPPASAALRDCIDPAVYEILQRVFRSPQGGLPLVEQNADALVTGLEDWAPAATFDADYRDRVVTALESKDYEGARRLIDGGIATGQWSLKGC